MKLIDGKKLAKEIKLEIAEDVKKLISEIGRPPHLAAILVGDSKASETYVAAKEKDCEQVGFESTVIKYPADIPEKTLLDKITEINNDHTIDGLIVQLPLPGHISEQKVTETIDPAKDVDGFHPMNTGRMVLALPSYIPATPYGIIEMIKRYEIPTEGKSCTILGRSNIVGTPMSLLMSKKAYPGNATVTVCHSRTKNIKDICRNSDILIVAMGSAEYLTADMVKEGAVVVDVGITRIKSDKTKSGWKLVGDVKFDEVAPKCSYITPVPGGVGPMTRVGLLKNTLVAARKEIYQ